MAAADILKMQSSAVLDEAHIGGIRGALGTTIRHGDIAAFIASALLMARPEPAPARPVWFYWALEHDQAVWPLAQRLCDRDS